MCSSSPAAATDEDFETPQSTRLDMRGMPSMAAAPAWPGSLSIPASFLIPEAS
jgi:hypothetical protein